MRDKFAVCALLVLAACQDAPGTPLAKAAAQGDRRQVLALLAAGVRPDETDRRGLTPLIWAARAGQVETIRALIGAGAQVDTRDTANGWTALQHAVHKNQKDAAGALLAAGADPNAALMMAAGYGQTAVVRELLARGADPRAEWHGVNALWAAAGGGAVSDITYGPALGTCYPDTARALLEAAPDLRIRGGWSSRVLKLLARSEPCRELLTLREEQPPPPSRAHAVPESRGGPWPPGARRIIVGGRSWLGAESGRAPALPGR